MATCLYQLTQRKLNQYIYNTEKRVIEIPTVTLSDPSVNKKDLRALTLVGPPWDNREIAPLAVLHLDNCYT